MKAFGLCTHVRKPLDAVQSLGNIGEKVLDTLSFFDMFLNCLISHSLAEVAFAGGGSAYSQYHSEASRDESTKGVKDNMFEGADLVFCLGGEAAGFNSLKRVRFLFFGGKIFPHSLSTNSLYHKVSLPLQLYVTCSS